MRRKTIADPQVDIGLRHYYYGASSEPAGYELTFVLWDRAEHGDGWFAENHNTILRNLEDLYPDYHEAFELLEIDPRTDSFHTIDFSVLSEPECAELRWWTYHGGEDAVLHYVLFVRKEGEDYLLNGGPYWTTWDVDNVEALPDTWAQAEAEGVLEDPDCPWFEARVPAKLFEQAFAAAEELLRREKLEERACNPDAKWTDRVMYGEFTR